MKKQNALHYSFDFPFEPKPSDLFFVHQVHGKEICTVESSALPIGGQIKADGIFTSSLNLRIGVQTADCMPVLFADEDNHCIAAVHGGWRGLNAGILLSILEIFRKKGVLPTQLQAWIGPCIKECCFEVGPEVVQDFQKSWGSLPNAAWKSKEKTGKYFLNLIKIAQHQLCDAGLWDRRIEISEQCTYCSPLRYASYRRATHQNVLHPSGRAARQWSWIQLISKQ